MCGIVGAAGSLVVNDENCFKQLLVVDSVRGNDSTGIASILRNGETKVIKQLGEPFTLMEYPQFKQAFHGQVQCLIGHNRFATTGKISKRNAHPFDFDTLVGVHNGTLTSKYELFEQNLFDTDSEALYNHIEKKGLKDAIDNTQGAYSLVWYDKEKKTINFLRNKERPMFVALSKDKKKMFWASEGWMLEGVMWRNNITWLDIRETAVDHHYSYEIPKAGEEFTKAKVTKIEQKVVIKNFTGGQTGSARAAHTASLPVPSLPVKKTKDYSLMYIGSTQVFEAVWSGVSISGGHYVQMRCPKIPECNFRVFYKNEEEKRKLLTTKSWSGKVREICEANSEYPYYKVDYSSLTASPIKSLIVNMLSKVTKKDHKGNSIGKREFSDKYKSCCWCNCNVEYEEAFRIISEKDVLCFSCHSDPEVAQYLPNIL